MFELVICGNSAACEAVVNMFLSGKNKMVELIVRHRFIGICNHRGRKPIRKVQRRTRTTVSKCRMHQTNSAEERMNLPCDIGSRDMGNAGTQHCLVFDCFLHPSVDLHFSKRQLCRGIKWLRQGTLKSASNNIEVHHVAHMPPPGVGSSDKSGLRRLHTGQGFQTERKFLAGRIGTRQCLNYAWGLRMFLLCLCTQVASHKELCNATHASMCSQPRGPPPSYKRHQYLWTKNRRNRSHCQKVCMEQELPRNQ